MLLITGGAGYIGSHIVSNVFKRNIPCVVVDDLSTGQKSVLPKTVAFEKCDIGNISVITQIFKKYHVDSVIHLAASILPDESLRYPEKYYKNNTVHSLRLWSLCNMQHVHHIVFSSTAAVYGPSHTRRITENATISPISPYGSSKAMAEVMLKDMAQTYRYVILRYFNVIGYEPAIRMKRQNTGHLLTVCLETALGIRSYVPVFGNDYETPDGTGIRDYIHVSDVVSAHLHALEYLKQKKKSGIYNVGYGRGTSVFDMIRIVHKVTGKRVPYKIFPRRVGDNATVIADNRKITRELGWIPHYADLPETVRILWKRLQQ